MTAFDFDAELPEGWVAPTVKEFLEVKYGKGLKESDRQPGDVPVYGSNGIVGTHNKAITAGSTIVLGRKGTVGAVNYSEQSCWPIDTTFYVDDFVGCESRYLFLGLRTLGLEAMDTSTAIPGLSRDDIYDCKFPLAPLAEQRRIVAKVEALLERVNKARERLDRVPDILKKFRQSVLAAACTGRLTADFRENNSDNKDSGDSLLRSIREQHKLLWEVEELRTLSAKGKMPKGENWKTKYKPDTELDLEGMPELPDSWAYARTDELVEPGTVITYGIVLPGPQIDNGIPYIRGQDIDDNGRILVEQLAKTAPAIAAKHGRSKIQEGDVLLCVIRNLRVAVVPAGLDGFNLTQGTVRLRPSNVVMAEYLARYLASPYAQEWMKQRYVGLDMPRINVRDSRAIPVPLPPLSEQREIVQRLQKVMSAINTAEERLAAAATYAKHTTQAVLAKAFAGELVDTEADLARREGRQYEPASMLLERIAVERVAAENGKPKRAKNLRKKQTNTE